MAATTYIILPSVTGKRGGKLVPGTLRRAKNQGKAVAAAERMAGHVAGLVVLEEQSDFEQDIFAESRIVRAIGQVPDEMIEALAA